jgi:hypothetical protein
MAITISEENQIWLSQFKDELNIIKKDALTLSVHFLIQFKRWFISFLLSYQEYSLSNIREHGLGEVLIQRAMRFFGLEYESKGAKTRSNSKKKIKKGIRFLLKKSAQLVLFPFYLMILSLKELMRRIHKKKNDKDVKNRYTP